jgi:hypothetical protein
MALDVGCPEAIGASIYLRVAGLALRRAADKQAGRGIPFDEVLEMLLNKEPNLVFYPRDVGGICGPSASARDLVVGEALTLVVAGRTKALGGGRPRTTG